MGQKDWSLVLPPSSRASSPLANPAFRALWIASVFSYLGTWVQDVGESWLMLSLTTSPLLVAMLTTCYTLPTLVLTFPAGVLADRVDRRRLLLVAQSWLALVAFVLAALTWAGYASPALLLVASAALGVGSAMTSPPWQSLLPDIVPRRQTADAITLNSVAFNLARAIGPAIGGLILGALGAGAAFFVNAVSFLAVIEVLRTYAAIRDASAKAQAARRAEPLLVAAASAFREVKASRDLRRCYAAVAVFGCMTGGMMALLPTFAKFALHTDARGYGMLLGGQGAGAVLAAFVLARLRGKVSAHALVSAAMAVFGACTLAMSATERLPLAVLFFVLAGVGWISTFTTLNALVQLNSPVWVKSRVIALYQMCFLAAWSVGATAAGAIAIRVGAAHAASLFALGALAAAAFTARQGLPTYEPRGSEPLSTPPPASARAS
jgi:MFS family permease